MIMAHSSGPAILPPTSENQLGVVREKEWYIIGKELRKQETRQKPAEVSSWFDALCNAEKMFYICRIKGLPGIRPYLELLDVAPQSFEFALELRAFCVCLASRHFRALDEGGKFLVAHRQDLCKLFHHPGLSPPNNLHAPFLNPDGINNRLLFV
jgi:hypothetical protein